MITSLTPDPLIDALGAREADLGEAQAELRTEHQARVVADQAAAVITAEMAKLLERLSEAKRNLLDPRPISNSAEPESPGLIGRGRKVEQSAANKSGRIGQVNNTVERTSLERSNDIGAERQGDLLEAVGTQEDAFSEGILLTAAQPLPSA